MTREEEIRRIAHEISQRCFPDSYNVWARPNIEARIVQAACCEIANWADKTMIDKACEWLNKGGYFVNNKETLEDFRKAMEE